MAVYYITFHRVFLWFALLSVCACDRFEFYCTLFSSLSLSSSFCTSSQRRLLLVSIKCICMAWLFHLSYTWLIFLKSSHRQEVHWSAPAEQKTNLKFGPLVRRCLSYNSYRMEIHVGEGQHRAPVKCSYKVIEQKWRFLNFLEKWRFSEFLEKGNFLNSLEKGRFMYCLEKWRIWNFLEKFEIPWNRIRSNWSGVGRQEFLPWPPKNWFH